MSNRNRRVATRRSVRKGKVSKWVAVWIVVGTVALLGYLKAQAMSEPLVYTNPAIENTGDDEAETAEIAQKYGVGDPCTLEVVKCHPEKAEAPQKAKYEASGDIEMIIRETFPEDPDTAVAIATCESQLEKDRIGDEAIAVMHGGELVGRSIGLYQIRTGEARPGYQAWNRAHANEMSVDQFEKAMTDPRANAQYARSIWLKEGKRWSGAWVHCSKKAGAR